MLGRGRAGDRARRADDLRDVPDHALPPGRRRAAGGDGRPAQRRALPARARAPGRTSTSTWSGAGWPPVNVRHEMLDEAVRDHPRAVRRRVRQLRGRALPGRQRQAVGRRRPAAADRRRRSPATQSAALAGELADAMIAVEPDARARASCSTAPAGRASARIGQVPICWDPSRDAAIERAHDQFRWFGGGWKVNAELPGTGGVRRRQPVRPPGGRRRVDPVRPGRRRRTSRRCGQFVDGGLHRRRRRADRRRDPARVPGLGRARAASGAAAVGDSCRTEGLSPRRPG